jgi:hypothetical protein
MRTPLEALFDAMITGGWANESDGHVESPTGHFARISNSESEVFGWPGGIKDSFADVISAYGMTDEQLREAVGYFLVMTDSQGFIHITRYHAESDLIRRYRQLEDQYADWEGEGDDGGTVDQSPSWGPAGA